MALSDDQITQMVDLLPKVTSLRDLARQMGVGTDTARKYAAPYVAILKAQNALPPCACGRERFHRYGCGVWIAGALGHNLKCIPPERREAMMHRRQLFLSMLEAGERFMEVDAAMGATKGSARSFARHLSPEQRQRREDAIRARQETNHGR